MRFSVRPLAFIAPLPRLNHLAWLTVIGKTSKLIWCCSCTYLLLIVTACGLSRAPCAMFQASIISQAATQSRPVSAVIACMPPVNPGNNPVQPSQNLLAKARTNFGASSALAVADVTQASRPNCQQAIAWGGNGTLFNDPAS